MRYLLFFALLGLWVPVHANVVVWDVAHLNLTTPPSSGDDSNTGNTAIGVWFNVASGEAYVVSDTAGIPGRTDLADGRFQLRYNTYWFPPSSDVIIQGRLPFTSIHGTSVAQPNAAAGSPARLGEGQAVPTGTAFVPANFAEMAGTFGVWRDRGRGFLALRFPIGFALHFGYADITILADGSIRLNGFAYNSVPQQGLTTQFIGNLTVEPAANLVSTAVSSSTVALRWEDRSDNESGFIIERSTGSGSFVRIHTTMPNVTTFVDEDLVAGQTYTYRIVATTGIDGAPSNEVTVTTASVASAPPTPDQFTAAPASPTSIQLSWVDGSGLATRYFIERSLNGATFERIAALDGGTFQFLDRFLPAGAVIHYRIVAFNGLESSPAVLNGIRAFSVLETVGVLSANAAFPGIDGSGVTIGLWDFAPARSTHREFQRDGGRNVTNREGGEGGSNSLSNHTTHGVGIMVATGVTEAARGVAPGAAVDVYMVDNDQQDKRMVGMEWPGQPGTLQISVAAYGPIRGWNPLSGSVSWEFRGSLVDGDFPRFDPELGGYTNFTHEADVTAWMRPYLLQVRSSGNDRNDGPRPGDFVFASTEDFGSRISIYDPAVHAPGDGGEFGGHRTVSDAAAARNILTVGAWSGATRDTASGNLLMPGGAADFDNWGPTFDGRIKPDIVAAGVSVFSAGFSADDAYSTLTGSSQAAPQAAAAAALLVQKWRDSGAHRYLRASTLRALLVHSADRLEGDAPSPRTGWGLLNARAALDQLHRHLQTPQAGYIKEAFWLGTPIEMTAFATGTEPLRLTLAWTDAPGTQPLNPRESAPGLVRDLDIRVIDSTGRIWEPWVLPVALDPAADPAAVAIRGRNPVDTIEQVWAAVPAGTVTVVISGPRFSGQDAQPFAFSLVASGMQFDSPVLPVMARNVSANRSEAIIQGIQLGARVELHPWHSSSLIPVEGIEVGANRVLFRHGSLSDGWYRVAIFNPDGSQAVLRMPVGAAVQEPSYEAWLQANFTGETLQQAKLSSLQSINNDAGLNNLSAYAFGAASPFDIPRAMIPALSWVAGAQGTHLQLNFADADRSDVVIRVQAASSPNGPWLDVPTANITSEVGPSGKRVTALDPVSLESSGEGRWMRLHVARD